MKIPDIVDIVGLNLNHIEQSGGRRLSDDNLLNPASLGWVLQHIQNVYFGFDPYPTLLEKAATLCWVIITEHVFHDGCKRTGASAMEILIRINGYELTASQEEVKDITLKVAAYREENFSKDDLIAWLRQRVSLKVRPGIY